MSSLPKVELHLHVDGAARYQTIWELAKQKNISVGADTIEGMIDLCTVTEPSDLDHMLRTFYVFMPTLIGDGAAIERISYELCEDQAKNGVVYFEGRFSPHFFSNTDQSETMKHDQVYTDAGRLTPAAAVEAVLRGFERGEKDFGVKARAILCSIRSHSHWSADVLNLADTYRNSGVVGIDIAGCAHAGADENIAEEAANVDVFQDAFKRGINRTVHAGESGSAADVQFVKYWFCTGKLQAVDSLKAQRIGHGYRILRDEAIYRQVTGDGIHFEICPTSSRCTGSVDADWSKHPIKKFLADNINFGLNTDDPTCFKCYINDEIQLCKRLLGFTDKQIWQCQLNAAKSCFLPDKEKAELVALIQKAEPK